MLPALATSGNRIVRRDTGEPVLLRGINRSGFEYACDPGITEDEIGLIVTGWNANIIRLPFNQQRVLQSGEEYLRRIDQVIEWTASRGAYTLLDLQWLSESIAPLPDAQSPLLWRTLADRYHANPAVLYDLYNEPHDVPVADWNYWATLLTDTIRSVHIDALIFVSGMDWGYDLRGVHVDAPGIVYSTHVYPDKQASWENAFGRAAGERPVFAGEWGGWEKDLAWGQRLARYFHQLEMGWTAWSWVDQPHLQHDGVPTAFGEIVRRQLAHNPPRKSEYSVKQGG
ncbi:MAG: cellulase family glycosylhydrolase [Bryobacterales bacterium]|nr:cellulase family glycosylhydrolase [Bryobacterales bacterium]